MKLLLSFVKFKILGVYPNMKHTFTIDSITKNIVEDCSLVISITVDGQHVSIDNGVVMTNGPVLNVATYAYANALLPMFEERIATYTYATQVVLVLAYHSKDLGKYMVHVDGSFNVLKGSKHGANKARKSINRG